MSTTTTATTEAPIRYGPIKYIFHTQTKNTSNKTPQTRSNPRRLP